VSTSDDPLVAAFVGALAEPAGIVPAGWAEDYAVELAAIARRVLGEKGSCISPPASDHEAMPSTVNQEYDLPDGAKLTLTWEADRPATEDELSLLARIARMIEGRPERARRER
jgi:hypothetical protein